MTDSSPPGPPDLGGAMTTDEDVAALEADLAHGEGGDRLARYTRRACALAWLVAAMVVGTAVVAIAASVAAWRDSPVVVLLAVLVCLPAVIAPIYVARRTTALARAATQPRELAAQARDLVGRVRHSTELHTLATRVVRRNATGGRARTGRLRSAFGMARLASTVVGQAQPDAERHPLLVPFTPERLAHTWSGVIVSLWAWLVAGLVVVVALTALAL